MPLKYWKVLVHQMFVFINMSILHGHHRFFFCHHIELSCSMHCKIFTRFFNYYISMLKEYVYSSSFDTCSDYQIEWLLDRQTDRKTDWCRSIYVTLLSAGNIKTPYILQELSEDNVVCQYQPNLTSNCLLVSVKSKINVFVYRWGWQQWQPVSYDNSSPNIYVLAN